MFNWNSSEHSYDENLNWAWLRAVEWGMWPLFLSAFIAPILFLFYPWINVVIAIVISTLLWRIIRYRYFNIRLANLGALIYFFRWIISISIGIYFLIAKNYFLFFLSAFWPLLWLIIPLQYLALPFEIGIMQKKIMKLLGIGLIYKYNYEGKKIKVLAIDDEPSVLESLKMILKIKDIEVITAPDGLKALELLTPEFDIVFTGFNMPYMNGFEVLGKIKEKYPFMPVAIISGYCPKGKREQALEKGAFEYLGKPFMLEEIYELIEKGLEWREREEQTNSLMKFVARKENINGNN